MAKSIKSRIDELVSRLGELPPPSPAFIKGKLVTIGNFVEALEEGAVVRDAEARAAMLEEENSNLKVELQALTTEVEGFRAEQKQREEKETKIDPVQLKILQRLGSPASCEWLRIDEISCALKIPIDETEIYVDGLDELGLVFFHPHEPGGGGWLRTAEGNKLVVAKRWAGETEEKKPYKHADLPPKQHEALVLIGGAERGMNEREIAATMRKSLAGTMLILTYLRDARMADDGEEADYGTGRVWVALTKGQEYLDERGLL
jgi:hypothetical protein